MWIKRFVANFLHGYRQKTIDHSPYRNRNPRSLIIERARHRQDTDRHRDQSIQRKRQRARTFTTNTFCLQSCRKLVGISQAVNESFLHNAPAAFEIFCITFIELLYEIRLCKYY